MLFQLVHRSRSGATIDQFQARDMSQWKVWGFFFDQVWEERTNACLALLREAADILSARGSAPPGSEDIVASLLWILSVPVDPRAFSHRPRWPMRYFEESEPAPPPPIDSCRRLAPRRALEEYD